MNLYEINQSIQDKMLVLAEILANGEIPTDDELQNLVDLQGQLDKKLVGYGFVVKNLTGELDSVDNEIKRLTAIKKAKTAQIDILKNRMQSAMMDNNLTKIDDPILPIRLQDDSQKSVRLDIDPIHLPTEFQKVAITADKTAIKKALEQGQEVKGAVLEQGQHIRIG